MNSWSPSMSPSWVWNWKICGVLLSFFWLPQMCLFVESHYVFVHRVPVECVCEVPLAASHGNLCTAVHSPRWREEGHTWICNLGAASLATGLWFPWQNCDFRHRRLKITILVLSLDISANPFTSAHFLNNLCQCLISRPGLDTRFPSKALYPPV